MPTTEKPLVISCPEPRSLELIFSREARRQLEQSYRIAECSELEIDALPGHILADARYIIGQPPLTSDVFEKLQSLKCIFNVESNLLGNMPYDRAFERGIHVVTTGAVFARPVAELGLAMALDAARGLARNDRAFTEGNELWGLQSNLNARLLSRAEVGIVGFGDLGQALNQLLAGFHTVTRVYDPWLPPSILRENGVEPANLDTVLEKSDFVFIVVAVTSDNKGFLGADQFASMREGAAFILLSRADVVDFPALMAAAQSGHIKVASDVFPEEPVPADHPVRTTPNFLRSAHRAGALDAAFKQMGNMVLEDMALLDKGLFPMLCKRAERETVSRLRSAPVSKN